MVLLFPCDWTTEDPQSCPGQCPVEMGSRRENSKGDSKMDSLSTDAKPDLVSFELHPEDMGKTWRAECTEQEAPSMLV